MVLFKMNYIFKIANSLILLFIFLLFSNIDTLNAESAIQGSVNDILYKINTNYSSIKSYQDTGIVKNSISTKEFETYFVRPNLFLFKWVEHMYAYSPKTLEKELYSTYYAIWSNDTGAYSHYYYKSDSNDGVQKKEDISSAVAGATGISNGAAHTIPSLLMENICGWFPKFLKQPVLSQDQVLDGVTCFNILGKHPERQVDYQLWIGKEDYLIRKIRKESPLGITVTSYKNILIDSEIPSSIFNFKTQGKNISKEKDDESFIKRISAKIDYLIASIRSRKIKPREVEYSFTTIDKVLLGNYQYTYFKGNVFWNIVEPVLYIKKIGNEKLAETSIKYRYESSLVLAISLRDFADKNSIKIDDKLIKEVIQKCNESMKKSKYGIEIVRLELKHIGNSIDE